MFAKMVVSTLLEAHSFVAFMFFCICVSTLPYPAESGPSHTGRPRLKSFHFDSNLIDGKSVRVFCQLSEGTVPVSFKWLKDGQPLTSSSPSSSSSSMSPSASPSHITIATFQDYSSLAINRVDRRRDNGNYTCQASNSYGTDQFSSLLNVQEPPVFHEKPSDISIGLGQSRVIKCGASTSYTIPEIRWNRVLTGFNSAGLALGKDARREHIATGEQLHLTDVREQDAGVYECVADPHNDLAISHTFTVTVNVPASFETKSDLLEVKRGETAKLICEAYGAKPIAVKWLRQNVRNGKYEEINLDFVPESFTYPRFTALEKNFDPSQPTSGGHKAHNNWHYVNNNRTLFELHINSVNSMDNGRYECHARNGFGEDRRRIDLFVQDVPAAVRNAMANTIWSRDVLITWLSPEMIGNSPIMQYVVQYWKEVRMPNQSNQATSPTSSSSNPSSIGGGHRLHEVEVSPTETQATIKNLTPGTVYVFRVIAINSFGRGPASDPVRVITQEEQPDAPPIDITAEAQGTSTLRIRWKAPPKSHWNGQLRGYYLGYRLLGTSGQESGAGGENSADVTNNEIGQPHAYKEVPFNGQLPDNYQEEYILSGLNRASLYSIIIKSFNGVGEGPNSQEIVASTAVNDPPSKPTLWPVENRENSVLLKWEQKPSATEITNYVFYYKEDKKSVWLEMTYSTAAAGAAGASESAEQQSSLQSANTYELTGLHPGTVYQIYMRSMADKSALSEPSETITVRTEGEIPLVNLEASPQSYPVAAIPTIHSQSTGNQYHLQPPSPTYPYGSSQQQQVPPYLRLAFILPVMIASVVIVIACVSAYVYIRIDDRKSQVKAYTKAAAAAAAAGNSIYGGTVAVPPGKRFQFISPGGGAGPFNTALHLGHNKHDMSNCSLTQSLVSEEGSLSFRYSDSSSDKSRPLLASRPMPPGAMPTGVLWAQQQSPIIEEDEAIVEIDSSQYETLPFQKNFGPASSTPMTSFNASFNQGHPKMNNMSNMNNTANSNHSSNSGKSVMSPAFPPPPPPLPGAFPSKSPANRPQAHLPGSNNIFCHVDVHHVQSSGSSDASDSYDEFHFFTPGGPQHV